MSNKPKVLMIDDSRAMHAIVRDHLSAAGVELYSALNGEEGTATAKKLNPDLILLDIEMPSPDGFEICRRLKDVPSLSQIPVIFLSGLHSTRDKVRGLDLGAIDFITKPFDEAELKARVRAALRNKDLLDLLSKKAMIDGLTGLYNRGYLDQKLTEELAFAKRHNRQLACIMIDVDGFKLINDVHGHGFGDTVLKGIGAILRETCRLEDLVCRFGGEEFAVLARETSPLAAMKLAERVRKAVKSATFTRGEHLIGVTCSLGVSSSGTHQDGIVDRADQALYLSKRNGRNRVTLFNDLRAAAA